MRVRDAAALDATLFVPTSSSFTSIDAVLGRGKALMNVTINLRHDLKLVSKKLANEGAVPVIAALGHMSGADVAFYWVLPTERFEMMCKSGKKPLISGKSIDGATFYIRQYAVCVPIKWRAASLQGAAQHPPASSAGE